MQCRKPRALFMAFGTKGDVYPIAAIAAAFACDRKQYEIFFVTHAAHQSLNIHLEGNEVTYVPVSSPPVLSPPDDPKGTSSAFSMEKKMINKEHRAECLSIMEKIFGAGPNLNDDFVVINFFALQWNQEGWSLAELFHVRCIVAAPYVVPYSTPSTFERKFSQELPHLYQYLQEAPVDKVSWKDVSHWMWPMFTEDWGLWRSEELNLSHLPFTDPITGLPMWHERCSSPLLMYGFSREVVECPDYWPSNAHVCGFWFLPQDWQFSCDRCRGISASLSLELSRTENVICYQHTALRTFLEDPTLLPLVFFGFSSMGSMGFLKNPQAFLFVVQATLEIKRCRFILFTAGYEPLDLAIKAISDEKHSDKQQIGKNDGIFLFSDRLLCFSGSIPYNWLFRKCAVAVHHGGSGSTAAALHAGVPQVICPSMLDQFYWAERMFWLGVAPEPLNRNHLLPETSDKQSVREASFVLSKAIDYALSPKVKAQAEAISERISLEDGVSEAVRILKEQVCCSLLS